MNKTNTVRISVDGREKTPLRRIWRYEGYDEVNYTYTRDGRALLAKLGRLSDAPYYIRAHFLLCSGDGTGSPKWGSSNVYTEDPGGNPVYRWDIIDRVFDTYLEAGCIPFVELGFMPEALSTAPPEVVYGDPREGGWKYPPTDYLKWQELMRRLALHCLERYGLRSVSRWYWELWNEPDIPFYWKGTAEEYCRLYDHTAAGLTAAFPQVKVGGPGTTNPGGERAGSFLAAFLEHCVRGSNAVTNGIGTRLDFISFHSKGGGFKKDPKEGKHTPSVDLMIDHIAAGLDITAGFPGLAGREIILTECDPDGGAASGKHDNPNLVFRNTEYYASYVASSVCRLIDLVRRPSPRDAGGSGGFRGGGEFRVDGMLTWAFEFEDREYFEGLRTLSTNGVDKPVLGVFRLLSRLGSTRIHAEIDGGRPDTGDPSAEKPEVGVIAAIGEEGAVQLFLCSHHDDWDLSAGTRVEVTVAGLESGGPYRMSRWAIDERHGNAHTVWREMGEPQEPTSEQISRLDEAGRPDLVDEAAVATDSDGTARLELDLPALSVSLVILEPAR